MSVGLQAEAVGTVRNAAAGTQPVLAAVGDHPGHADRQSRETKAVAEGHGELRGRGRDVHRVGRGRELAGVLMQSIATNLHSI